MAELNTGNVIQDLICSSCNKYLSRSPIFILPQGESVCENCSILNSKVKPYRENALETVLCGMSFPCQNKKYGCKDTYKFNSDLLTDHEDKCTFREIKCTFHSIIECDWKGTVTDFTKHVTLQHSSFIQKTADFEIDLNVDKKYTFLVFKESDLFLFSYKYDSNTFHLAYIVASYTPNIKAQCRMLLTNTLNTDYTLEFKGCDSVYYFEGLLHAGIENFVNLRECKSLLNNAQCVNITINITVALNIEDKVLIDYKVLNSHKCQICKYYLVLPIFRESENFICNNCHYDVLCEPIPLDAPESILLANQNYPCRWHKCDKILKGYLIGKHQIECEFRMYNCFCCKSTPYRSTLHLVTKHQEKCMFNLQTPVKIYSVWKYILVTFAKHEFIRYSISFENEKFYVKYITTSKNVKEISCTIKFTHEHCKAESNDFEITPNTEHSISVYDLPDCFRSDTEVCARITVF